MSDRHDCPGLQECDNHPKWSVTKHVYNWEAWSPGCHAVDTFDTHFQAAHYAQKEATR